MSYSYISNAHPAYIDNLYQQFKEDPTSVGDGWGEFFQGFEYANQSSNGQAAQTERPSSALSPKEFSVLDIIHGFRQRGHLLSTTNPIRTRRDRKPHLNLADYNLKEADLDEKFIAGNEIGLKNATLRDIIKRLEEIYCGNIGYEYSYIEKRERRNWLRKKIEEKRDSSYNLSLEKKRRILKKLNGAVGFENFLAKKYVAQKRFGLEGGESAIAGLDGIINKGSELGVKEVVIGMAHRGRLNVLANVMGKTYEEIFNEFEGEMIPDLSFGDGDVKYHLGYSSRLTTPSGNEVDLKLTPNPSHLEAVDPVVEGFARSKADILYDSKYDQILPILIHGDAAVAGQGVVYETVQMSTLEGYHTGGTLHFVINNQIGFTTDFDDARSSTYCTGVAQIVQAPVFHVNGDDPEALLFASELAMEYRQKFNQDVFIDMVCYRKHGHNEGDDPKFTQPQMYEAIKEHKDPRTIYTEKLISEGKIESEMAKQMSEEFDEFLQERLNMVKEKPLPYKLQEPERAWKKLKLKTSSADYEKSPDTSIPEEQLKQILERLQNIPEEVEAPRKTNRLLKQKRKLIDQEMADWAMGEHLAYGSILLEGKDVRMSGQDVRRGTFSHRHAVFHDVNDEQEYNRLDHLGEEQGKFRIFNSFLSEFAVLGFEYGYSLGTPDSLVVWEAQFGDFVNGAQTIIDQFISSSESKWQRMSGIVMLLPHGYEGQGPEHSSARLERFLQLCAEFNMTVANATTPANFFHLLRRQLARPFRKPLIVMTPKLLLRHPKCVSPFKDFTKGGFQEVIDDPSIGRSKKKLAKVKKVLCCSGKIYYDLLERKEEEGRDDIAIVRLEQLYPFPKKQVDKLIHKYEGRKVLWVQEEPSNMGAWQYILAFYRNYDVQLVGRKSSASTATGFKKVHEQQQQRILDLAFEPVKEEK